MTRTEEEKQVLLQYFTNVDKPVFAFKNLSPQVAAALIARFSRAKQDIRTIFLKEFAQHIQSSQSFDSMEKAGEDFLGRVLIGYGDDSVAQGAGVHFACEGISNIAIKAIEDARIGAAAIERSSRYIEFNQKDALGFWPYVFPSVKEENSNLFKLTANVLFETYAELLPAVKEWLHVKYPVESNVTSVARAAHEAAIRGKACDLLRGLLPMATKTSAGFFFTGQALEHTLTKMLSKSRSGEISRLGTCIHQEVGKIVPLFVRRAGRKEELPLRNEKIKRIAGEIIEQGMPDFRNHQRPSVELIASTQNPYGMIAGAILYPHVKAHFGRVCMEMGYQYQSGHLLNLFNAYVADRQSRRDKPGRALEAVDFVFDIVMDIGAWRDLQRHRLCTQEPKPFSTDIGFVIPEELHEIKFVGETAYDKFSSAMFGAKNAYEILNQYDSPESAQYIVPFASLVQFSLKVNLRELVHICELRSIPQGHEGYRQIVQMMWRTVTWKYPHLSVFGQFVDFNMYDLGRIKEETRNETKREKLTEKE